ncbi:MAG: nucleotidyltransferase domain-containing protein [Alphaproteobacteria bacterium]
MRLRCDWDKAAGEADKTRGAPDVELEKHLKDTGQTSLPQAELLQGCFNLLRDKGLMEEAYLRGSLGRGHADTHSDIDLFTVVKPEKIDEVYKTVCEYLESKGRIITNCHDRLVQNYGGIGFMFVAQSKEHADKVYQFDLYLAMQGVPPCNPTSIKPRIFAKDPDAERWINQNGQKACELPQNAKDFITAHTSGSTKSERMELLMQELLINLYVTHKHIKRGQMSRTVVDNHGVVTSAIEFLQLLTDYRPTGYSPVYLGDEIVRFAQKNGDKEMQKAAGMLHKLFAQPMSDQKLADTLAFGKFVLQKSFPERYESQREAIEFFEQNVLKKDAESFVQRKPPGIAHSRKHG